MNDNDMIITNVINEGNQNNVSLIWSRTSDGYYNMLEDRNYVYTYGVDLTKTYRFIMSGRILKTDIYIRLPS